MPTITREGRSLYYSEHPQVKKGRTLLLIHGAGGSQLVWHQPFNELLESRVLALDLPGHGRSDPPGRRTVDQYTYVLEDFITALNLSELVLVGHSMGSAIALTAALRRVVTLDGLILFGASARMPVGDALLGGSLSSLNEVASFIAERGIADAPPEYRHGIRQQVLATGGTTTFGDFMACNRFDFRSSLAQIDVPALIIAGKLDRMTPLRFSESLADGLPKSRLSVLEGTGHFAMLERPDAVVKIIRDFLLDLSRSPGM